jgi:nucleotide-binding universal stress UspA family protein
MPLSPESYGGFVGLPGVDTLALEETSAQAAHELVEAIAAGEHLLDAEQRVAFGLPAERLVVIAEDEDAELIVVGSRGRGPLKAAILGSVSHQVIGLAGCPVMVVPAAARAHE